MYVDIVLRKKKEGGAFTVLPYLNYQVILLALLECSGDRLKKQLKWQEKAHITVEWKFTLTGFRCVFVEE